MRISDWSSDVCSSDLMRQAPFGGGRVGHGLDRRIRVRQRRGERFAQSPDLAIAGDEVDLARCCPASRSEEHTSELQSLMRISYAVFCLKKKKCPLSTHPYHKIQKYITTTNPRDLQLDYNILTHIVHYT